MKHSSLFVSMLVSAVAMIGCATTSEDGEEPEDILAGDEEEVQSEADEAVGEAEGELGFATPWAQYGVVPQHYSHLSPTTALFNGQLYMAHLGNQTNQLYWSQFNGNVWSQKFPLTGYNSFFNPALATYNNYLNLAYLDATTNELFWSQYDGYQWNSPVGLGFHGVAAPAFIPYNNSLYMMNLNAVNNELLWSAYDGNIWSPFVGTGIYSQTTPALAVYNNQLHMLHQGRYSSRLAWSTFDGNAWITRNDFLPNRMAFGAPALGVYGNDLYFMHRGVGGSQLFWGNFNGTAWNDLGVIPGFNPVATPALAPFGNQFFMLNPFSAANTIGHYSYCVTALGC